jgi:hypothetical protein
VQHIQTVRIFQHKTFICRAIPVQNSQSLEMLDIAVHDVQSVGIFSVDSDISVHNIRQCKIFRQSGYSNANYSVSQVIPAENMRSVRLFQCKTFGQSGYSSGKHEVSQVIPVQNIRSVRLFRYKIFSQSD